MDFEYWTERIQSYWWIRPLKTPPPNMSPPFPLSDDSDDEGTSGGARRRQFVKWKSFLNTFSSNKSDKLARNDEYTSLRRKRGFSSSFRFKKKEKREEDCSEVVPSSVHEASSAVIRSRPLSRSHTISLRRIKRKMEPVVVSSSGLQIGSKPLDSYSGGGGDSDLEDDPGKLLNVWLGELDKMKQGLDSPTMNSKGSNLPSSSSGSSTLLRRQKAPKANNTQYRCSLINIEETQDEELDAILGELSVLESQINSEIKKPEAMDVPKEKKPSSPLKKPQSNGEATKKTGARTESPDNDSAFCDNASVLSSSSSVRTDQSAKSSSGISSSASPTTASSSSSSSNEPDSEEAKKEKEAKIKAEKIKLAIEKIKEASIKKLFIKVFTADESAKSILVDEKMSVRHVTRILAEKNHVKLDTKWALVELIPDLYMERVYEDHENLVENCLMWKIDSKNTLWFIERPEKFDVFFRPENYLLGSSSSQNGEQMDEHSRQELLEEYFSSSGVSAPEVEGFIHLKAEGKKSWKKFYFVLRSSGLYYAPKGKKNSKDLVCLSTFDVNQVYYGTGWRKKYKAPSDFCFAIKNPTIQAKNPKYIRYLCVDSEKELHKWVTGIRIAKNGHQLYENFRGIEEEMVHEDLDILTSKRFSGINSKFSDVVLPLKESPSKKKEVLLLSGDAITPSSENKSFDSALSSSGIASDIYSGTGESHHQQPLEQQKQAEGNLCKKEAMDRSSSTSSGCLSSTSSSTHPRNGFESDFPLGGTIKKRPNARLPLHSWEEDHKSEEEDDVDGANVRVGGGGTLLRPRQSSFRSLHHVQIHRPAEETSYPPPPPSTSVDPLSEAFENNLPDTEEEDFPPPPPPIQPSESLSYLADLPPPPPELLNDEPTLLITPKTRKISFDDHVQLIEPCPPPNRLGSPPKAFLRDLQRVMTKKWQIAEKCREDRDATPHHVLGFRDEISHLVGTSQRYSRDDSIGQWILQNQIYSDAPPPKSALKTSTQFTEPLYAVSSKIPDEVVILREPTPEYDPYSLRHPADEECSNYSTIQFNRTGSFSSTSSSGKRLPPPPPRRSENTHLTSH